MGGLVRANPLAWFGAHIWEALDDEVTSLIRLAPRGSSKGSDGG